MVNKTGFYIGQQRYLAPWMKEEKSLLLSTFGKKVDVIGYRDPDVPEAAYCSLGDGELRYMKIKSKHTDDIATYDDIVDFEAYNELNGKEHFATTMPEKTEIDAMTQSIVGDATKATKQAHKNNPKSKSERTAHLDKNRVAEKARELNKQYDPSEDPSEQVSANQTSPGNETPETMVNAFLKKISQKDRK
ncbi:hypothetical protein GCM10011396_23070 [Undibacterium terreum]|uniref:Uncharacterized protein n=1 Tax=Undibacterium terreum TaxID=1224302 RepID=A0A916UJS9_9BURK|nr:hypothetical protein GCM10011396_23070 [Undibacterium terreum]